LGLTATLCRAEEPEPSQPAVKELTRGERFDRYYERSSKKFDSGAVNFVAGLSEVPREAMDRSRDKKGFWKRSGSVFAGAGMGLVDGLLDMAGGMGNMLTSPMPQFQIPLPHGGIDVDRITGS
jgi:hypothetical protein